MVPAHSLLAPALACVIAAARVMPDVCGVFKSSSSERTILTPCFAQSMSKPLLKLCVLDAAKFCSESTDPQAESIQEATTVAKPYLVEPHHAVRSRGTV